MIPVLRLKQINSSDAGGLVSITGVDTSIVLVLVDATSDPFTIHRIDDPTLSPSSCPQKCGVQLCTPGVDVSALLLSVSYAVTRQLGTPCNYRNYVEALGSRSNYCNGKHCVEPFTPSYDTSIGIIRRARLMELLFMTLIRRMRACYFENHRPTPHHVVAASVK